MSERRGIIGSAGPAWRWLGRYPNARWSVLGIALISFTAVFPVFLRAVAAVGTELRIPNVDFLQYRVEVLYWEFVGLPIIAGAGLVLYGICQRLEDKRLLKMQRGPEQNEG